ncbi:MAG: hypothetical protein KKC20_14940 [Proteobacteria bacterium]|nr:hypothetical protein [Pseudomonadota bacterium]
MCRDPLIFPIRILLEWDTKCLVSREAGTMIHGYIESLLLGKEPVLPHRDKITDPKATEDICDKIMKLAVTTCGIGKLAVEEILDLYEIVGLENIVASIKAGIATLVDVQAINNATGQQAILDWKSNEKIGLSNRWRTGSGPCSVLEDCNCEERPENAIFFPV